ncbi:acetolactate synthase large subunit [Ensifer sp. MJa1]|uniref:acetolactate synthase large subunit n=1 Tax=Ensifer sp. MJa1 TaxID=2919888 RepID=UPI00300A5EC3
MGEGGQRIRTTGADMLVDTLLTNGVDVCFANPGTSEMHFVAALDRKPEMRCILGLAEGVVTGAADGYARMTGSPAATLLHTGPGLANSLANLHNARRARTPVINVVGDHASYHLALDAPLTSDIESLARPMSNWVRRAKDPSDVGPTATAAYRASLTPPGVATMILPADASWGAVSTDTPPQKVLIEAPQPASPETIRKVARLIRSNPAGAAMVLSGTAAQAESLAIAGRIAAACNVALFNEVLVAHTQRGRGRVAPRRIPYPIDMALETLRDVRVLILVGAPEPVAFFAYPGKPGRLVPEGCDVVTLARHGEDLKASLEALSDELGISPTHPLPAAGTPMDEGEPSGTLTEDAIAVIFSNRAYAILHAEMRNVGVEEIGTNARRMLNLDQPAFDWVSLARGFGVEAAVATSCEAFAALFDAALMRRGPFLIEARLA